MAWNQQNGGGGWKSGGGNGGGPWGQGGGGKGGGQPPDFEEMLRRGQSRMKDAMGGGGGGVPGIVWILGFIGGAAALLFYQFTFTVKPDELGVVLRFGKYEYQAGPGLHFKFPYPVDEVLLPKVTRENSVEIGMRTVRAGRTGGTPIVRDVPQESLMLTGDENIVDVDFTVFWRIDAKAKDDVSKETGVQKFLFNLQYPETTVKEVAESAMREIVGKADIQRLTTEGRQETQEAVMILMQNMLDSYGAGIKVTRVNLQKVDPPEKVIGAFRDVQAARADQERLQNEARAYANRVVPEARGAAQRILQKAEGYRAQVVEEAKGQASRFDQVLTEYKKAPDVTRQRIYLETIERVFSGIDKIIIDPATSGGSGVVPYLPLQELGKRDTTTKGAQ